jgi:hypothetical protein
MNFYNFAFHYLNRLNDPVFPYEYHLVIDGIYTLCDTWVWLSLEIWSSPALCVSCKQHELILLNGWMLLHCVHTHSSLTPYLSTSTQVISWLGYVNSTAVNRGEGVHDLQECYCWITQQLYFQVSEELHTDSHSGCTNLHSHQQWLGFLSPSHPCSILLVCFLSDCHSAWEEMESQCHFFFFLYILMGSIITFSYMYITYFRHYSPSIISSCPFPLPR